MSRALPSVLALVALGATVARWLVQGSQNMYTDAAKRFYVPDPVLEWRLEDAGPIWLGLDAVALVGGLMLASGALSWIASRKAEAARLAPLAWVPAAVATLPAIFAFASGRPPPGAQETRPTTVVAVPMGLSGGLPGLSSGRFVGLPREDSVVASIDAGGEVFDARFEVSDAWVLGDPGDLRQPLRAEVVVDAASIDTGVRGRSAHATEYLDAVRHPSIAVRLVALTAAGSTEAGASFSAEGELQLMGTTLPITITGRLERGATPAEFLVDARFPVRISETPLKAHRSDFGDDQIEIRVVLPFTTT